MSCLGFSLITACISSGFRLSNGRQRTNLLVRSELREPADRRPDVSALISAGNKNGGRVPAGFLYFGGPHDEQVRNADFVDQRQWRHIAVKHVR